MVLLEGMQHVKATGPDGQTVWLTGYHYQQKRAEWGPNRDQAKYINAGIDLEQLARLEHFTTIGGKTTVRALTFVDPEQQEASMPDPTERDQRKDEREQRKDQAEQEREQRKEDRTAEREQRKEERDQNKPKPDNGDPEPNQDLPTGGTPPKPSQLPA